MPKLVYTFLLLLAVVFWGSAFVAIRIALHHGFHPGSLAFFRYALAAIILIILCGKWLKPKNRLTAREWLFVIVTGLSGVAFYSVSLNMGETKVSAGIAAFIISQESVLIPLLCMWFFQEVTPMRAWWGIFLSVIGIALIALSKSHNVESILAVVWIVVAAIFASFYNVFQRKIVPRVGSLQFIMYAILASAIVLCCIYLPQFLHDWHAIDVTGISAGIFLAIFPGILGYWLLSITAPKLPISHVAASLFLIPVVASILGVFVLNEIPTLMALLGACLTLVGAVWVQLVNKEKT